MGGLLFQAFIYLCAAVIAVPIAKRLGLGLSSAICSPASSLGQLSVWSDRKPRRFNTLPNSGSS